MVWNAPLSLLMAGVLLSNSSGDDALAKAQDAFKKKAYPEALKFVNEAIDADGKNAEAFYVRGLIQMELRHFPEAIADFSKTFEVDPKAAVAFDQRGIAHFKSAMIKESLADFDKFIALVPKAGPGHWRRGLTLYYADEFAKGVAQFTTSDKEEPNDVENAVWHFLCNARVQGLAKARTEMLKVKNDPRGPYFMKIYDLFLDKAKPEDVLAAAESGNTPRQEQRFYANYYVGMYYESIGEPKKSLEYLKKAVAKYPIGHYMMDVARVHIKLREGK